MTDHKTPDIYTITEGTVSHGTLRTVDLVPTFYDLLRRIDPSITDSLTERYGDVIDAIVSGEEVRPDDEQNLMEDLFDALDAVAAEHGFYFGAHPGDGSDFGWWKFE